MNLDKIVKLKEVKTSFYNGLLKDTTAKATAKKTLVKLLSKGNFEATSFDDEGDLTESYETKRITDSTIVVFLDVGSNGISLMEKDSSIDSDEDDEGAVFYITDTQEINGWLLGKATKKLNSVKLDGDQVVAIRVGSFDELPFNSDTYMDANLNWIFEMLVSDYDFRYGEDINDENDEEIDDGD